MPCERFCIWPLFVDTVFIGSTIDDILKLEEWTAYIRGEECKVIWLNEWQWSVFHSGDVIKVPKITFSTLEFLSSTSYSKTRLLQTPVQRQRQKTSSMSKIFSGGWKKKTNNHCRWLLEYHLTPPLFLLLCLSNILEISLFLKNLLRLICDTQSPLSESHYRGLSYKFRELSKTPT